MACLSTDLFTLRSSFLCDVLLLLSVFYLPHSLSPSSLLHGSNFFAFYMPLLRKIASLFVLVPLPVILVLCCICNLHSQAFCCELPSSQVCHCHSRYFSVFHTVFTVVQVARQFTPNFTRYSDFLTCFLFCKLCSASLLAAFVMCSFLYHATRFGLSAFSFAPDASFFLMHF